MRGVRPWVIEFPREWCFLISIQSSERPVSHAGNQSLVFILERKDVTQALTSDDVDGILRIRLDLLSQPA
jgi:chemotaxis signal transduction protein